VFITIPAVFSQIPGGQLLMIAFFVLASVAATGAMLSLMEVPVVILHERFGMSRAKATPLTIAGLILLGSTCALTNNLLADFKLFGMNMFDLFDFVSSNLLLPLGGILLAVFVGWVWSAKFAGALPNQGALANGTTTRIVFFLLRYVSPVLILLVMLKGLNMF
jgi:NSS family neurotransmitter:Na+ symporter